MLRLALLALFASCFPGTGCEWYPTNGTSEPDPCEQEPWREATVAPKLVVATRPGCFGFPDAELDYRLYVVAQPWQLVDSGSFELKHFDPRLIPADAPYYYSAHGSCAVDSETRLRCGASVPW